MTPHHSGHLDLKTVAAFVEGRLGNAARREAASHLAVCDHCRAELVAASEVVTEHRRSRRRRPTIALTLATATVALVAVGTLLPRGGGPPDAPPARTATGRSTELAVLQPADGALLAGPDRPVVFSWRGGEPGSRYRLRVLDERGAIVWEAETGDTTVTLPADVLLASGPPYYWHADALGADGRSLTTGTHRFRVR